MAKKVLIVEDNELNMKLFHDLLEAQGYEVIGVASTIDALVMLRTAPVCCILADHMLHGQTGLELAQEMKKMKPEVPIILHSGTVPETIHGIDVYVNKGEPTETFLSIVRDVIQRYCSL